MRCPVRPDQPVATEVAVTERSNFAIITTIGIILLTLITGLKQTLINPVPDEASLEQPVLLNHIPVVLQVTGTVAHGMSILAHNKRTVKSGLAFIQCIFFYCSDPRIHRAPDVSMPLAGTGGLLGSLILYGPGLIPALDPFVSLHKILSVTGLIAQ